MDVLSHRTIGLAFGLAVYLNAQPTQASFINIVRIDGHAPVMTSLTAAGGCSAPEKASERERSPSRLLTDDGIIALPADASSGMGSCTSSSVQDAPPFALWDTYERTSGRIMEYLAAQPAVLLSVPFLAGVFRPPRA